MECRTVNGSRRGFTLIELLVVMAIVATLLTLAVPRYFGSIDHSREVALRHDLATLREALDRHFADTGRYPDTLDELANRKYLRSVVADPVTESSKTWILVPPENRELGGVSDVRSGAPGKARDGTSYKDW